MAKICTTVEQSKKLMELGLDVNTADMYNVPYFGSNEYRYCISQPMTGPNCSPAWSLTALLELMPNGFIQKYNGEYSIVLDTLVFGKSSKDSVDIAFEMVCCLLENKKL